jgi:hypothetical protein
MSLAINQKNKFNITVYDSVGRKIEIEKPNLLKKSIFIQILGKLANNSAYTNSFWWVSWIKSINDEPVRLTTKIDYEKLLQRLDDEAVVSIVNGVAELYKDEAPQNGDREVIEEAKKSPEMKS